ncbi:DUF3742 family protein [Pseudomonas caricapapayae]|uniref:DUF3742 family protein n=1 Tax=Pseudomonas caricapapayae TaxID=46678 RepID=UPI0006D5E0EC|nr:DUF3742 family protein [Pseudomonas caricapapayae]KAA8690545.1 DUF3742 family protein [Pseudomonas caricapapayae]RMV98445.1 hypothetical protein ALP01_200376 [Pseudomonas caricapapayae]
MSTYANTDLRGAARFGHVLGLGLRRILNVERAVWSLLRRAGAPGLIVTPVKWATRVAAIGTGAFFAAWGLLYVLAAVAMVSIGVFLINRDGSAAAPIPSSSYEDDEYTSSLQASTFEENDDHNWDFVLGRGVYPTHNE